MELQEIKSYPKVIGNVHESAAYRSYHTLQLVFEMLERGDSHESILMVIRDIENAK